MAAHGVQAMVNLFRSLSSFIGARADDVPVQNEPVATLHADPALSPAPPTAVPSSSSDTHTAPLSAAPALPLVAYGAPREELVPPRSRRPRSVGLLRGAATGVVTSRVVPALPGAPAHPLSHPAGPLLTQTERVRLQVMQAQIQLSALRLYEGPIDGHMSLATATAVRHFQTLKGLRPTGMLATGTLVALGVPASG